MRWLMRTKITLRAVATGLVLAMTGVVSAYADARVTGLSFEEIAPPPQEAKAIRYSTRKSENPSPETWLRRARADAPAWWMGPVGEEILVRNVSQATLTPFLPDTPKTTGAAMILAPGGGTIVLGMELHGYQIAKWLNDRGIAAFVLKYRLVPTPKDLSAFLKVMEQQGPINYSQIVSEKQQRDESLATHEDGVEAVRYLRMHASEFKISPDRIGFMGFSAGGFTAAGVALDVDAPSRPDIVALIYGTMPGALKVTASAPPVFIAATSDDPLYSVGGSADQYLDTYRAWQQARVPAELHIFDSGGHGFGITPKGKSSDQWTAVLEHWLRERGFIPREGAGRR